MYPSELRPTRENRDDQEDGDDQDHDTSSDDQASNDAAVEAVLASTLDETPSFDAAGGDFNDILE